MMFIPAIMSGLMFAAFVAIVAGIMNSVFRGMSGSTEASIRNFKKLEKEDLKRRGILRDDE